MIASTLLLHGADLGQVAPVALRVHAAAEHELIRDLQADEIRLDGFLDGKSFFDQYGAANSLGTQLEQAVADGVHGFAVVEDVVENEDRARLDLLIRPHAPLHGGAVRLASVARY